MKQIQNFYQTLSWFLSTKSTYLDKEGPWVLNMIASNLSYLYQALPELELKKEKKSVNISYFEEDLLSKDHLYLHPIQDLKNHINQ